MAALDAAAIVITRHRRLNSANVSGGWKKGNPLAEGEKQRASRVLVNLAYGCWRERKMVITRRPSRSPRVLRLFACFEQNDERRNWHPADLFIPQDWPSNELYKKRVTFLQVFLLFSLESYLRIQRDSPWQPCGSGEMQLLFLLDKRKTLSAGC